MRRSGVGSKSTTGGADWRIYERKPKKRFSLNPDDIPSLALEKESFDIRVENTRLKEENEILKQKIDALLTFIKDHKEKE